MAEERVIPATIEAVKETIKKITGATQTLRRDLMDTRVAFIERILGRQEVVEKKGLIGLGILPVEPIIKPKEKPPAKYETSETSEQLVPEEIEPAVE